MRQGLAESDCYLGNNAQLKCATLTLSFLVLEVQYIEVLSRSNVEFFILQFFSFILERCHREFGLSLYLSEHIKFVLNSSTMPPWTLDMTCGGLPSANFCLQPTFAVIASVNNPPMPTTPPSQLNLEFLSPDNEGQRVTCRPQQMEW